jgi:uroporphyrinogen decarboxylase
MNDLIENVKINGKQSFEDAIQPISEFKRLYGQRVAALGGVDVDKLCRMPEADLRANVRSIIAACLPGGRFGLGLGNTVTNYVPLANYFAIVKEGLTWQRG